MSDWMLYDATTANAITSYGDRLDALADLHAHRDEQWVREVLLVESDERGVPIAEMFWPFPPPIEITSGHAFLRGARS